MNIQTISKNTVNEEKITMIIYKSTGSILSNI